MKFRFLAAIFFVAASVLALRTVLIVGAAPLTQNPNPTDEPTKRPYVFPTPIFIPTFVSATDLPARITTTPIATLSLAGAQSYTVEAGDNPSVIAKKVYGDAGKFQLIVEANNLTEANRLRVGQVLIIPPLTPIAATQLPTQPSALAQSTPSVARPNFAIPQETEFPPEPVSDTADLAKAAENALLAMGVVLFVGFLAISITAYLVYQRSLRAEKIAAIKRRLKGD